MEAANGAPPTPNVVLIGMMCSGKSSAGRELAKRLDAALIDTDDEIESAAGMAIPEIWEREGESGFRLREVTALLAVREVGANGVVVATGGGILMAEHSASLVREIGRVVYLRCRPDTLAARACSDIETSTPETAGDLSGNRARPLLRDASNVNSSGLEAKLAELLSARTKDYEEAADLIVDVDDLDPQGVAEKILAGLDGQCGE